MIGVGVSLRASLAAGKSAGEFSPRALFALSEPGVWYDPSDLTTMFQDRAGTTLVTTPGQSVGLVLDKSQGLVLGANIAPAASGWTGGAGWTINVAQASATLVNAASSSDRLELSLAFNPGLPIGGTLELTLTVESISGGSISFIGSRLLGVTSPVISTTGTFRYYARVSNTGAGSLAVSPSGAGVSAIVSNISVREIPGNHMVATADASRGTYGIEPFGGRRNLLTFTEVLTNAVWKTQIGGTGSAPVVNPTPVAGHTSGVTAYAVTFNVGAGTTVNDFSRFFQDGIPGQANLVARVARVWVRVTSGTASLTFDIPGTASATTTVNLTTDWQQVTVTGTASVAVSGIAFRASGNLTNGSFTVEISAPQIELGSTATPYQRVTTAFDVTEAGVPTVHYVQFDGADDGYLTSTITPGTDKVQVFAGVQKLSDAFARILIETSANAWHLTSAGSFLIAAPLSSSASERYGFLGRGSATPAVGHTATLATASAPDTAVLTAIGDIAADLNVLRRNGVAGTNATLDQGTGNYLAYPLYIGRRGGTSLPFNGRLYQMVVRFGPNLDASRIEQVERFINSKTGAY